MAVDASLKKFNWIRRVVAKVVAEADAINDADPVTLEYVTNAFNGGDPQNRPEYAITDDDLKAAGFPHMNAAKLNALIGGHNAIRAAYQANSGVIEAARP